MKNSTTMQFTILIPLALMLASCASKPIVDTYQVDLVQYEKDLAQCEEIADQVATGEITAKSAAFGAGVGAAYGAIGGHVGTGAATGAITGGAAGLLKSDEENARVTKRCLRHRGYVVLN